MDYLNYLETRAKVKLSIIVSCDISEEQIPGAPSLGKLLARGDRLDEHHRSSFEYLYDLFLPEKVDKNVLPIAAITALSDLDLAKDKIWMRADPVFLHADLSSLILFDCQKGSLTKEDVAGFFSVINPMLEKDGLCLICGDDPTRWYVELNSSALENDKPITTTRPGLVNGKDIRQFLPQGKDRSYWVRLGNEIQMLLHDCSTNLERKKRGEVSINSIWFWGAGKCPDQAYCQFDKIITNDVNARGLAIWSGVSCENVPTDFSDWLESEKNQQHILLVLSQGDMALSESPNQREWLIEQERLIFEPALSNLKNGKIKSLEIISNDQHRKIQRHHLLRFWR